MVANQRGEELLVQGCKISFGDMNILYRKQVFKYAVVEEEIKVVIKILGKLIWRFG